MSGCSLTSRSVVASAGKVQWRAAGGPSPRRTSSRNLGDAPLHPQVGPQAVAPVAVRDALLDSIDSIPGPVGAGAPGTENDPDVILWRSMPASSNNRFIVRPGSADALKRNPFTALTSPRLHSTSERTA